MKTLKKYFVLLLFVPLLITSCSDDSEDEPQPVIGCTDPNAVNYNPNADQQGEECLYTLVGDWTCYYYNYEGQDVLSAYSYIDIHFYDDSSYYFEAELNDGSLVQSTGVGSLNDATDTLTLIPDNGSANENWNMTYLDGEYVFMNMTDASGFFHDTEWIRY